MAFGNASCADRRPFEIAEPSEPSIVLGKQSVTVGAAAPIYKNSRKPGEKCRRPSHPHHKTRPSESRRRIHSHHSRASAAASSILPHPLLVLVLDLVLVIISWVAFCQGFLLSAAMNRATSSFDQKPPLAVSPRRLRPRRGRPEAAAAAAAPPTPPAPSPKETQHLRRSCVALEESPLKTEYGKISRELKAQAKRAQDDFPNGDALRAIAFPAQAAGVRSSPLFERGRLYELYSARRNERLKRKMEETFEEEAEAAPARRSAVDAEVVVKRRSTTRTDSLRMSAPEGLPAVGRTPSLRSSLRSSTRENKMTSVLRSAVKYADEEGRRASARSGRCK